MYVVPFNFCLILLKCTCVCVGGGGGVVNSLIDITNALIPLINA